MTRYFEDFVVGQTIRSPGRTITEADVMLFAGLSGDLNPAHTDRQFAAATEFRVPIAHGLLGLVIASGLADRDGSMDGSAIAMLGVEWRFMKPVFFGDTIRLDVSVASKRLTSKAGRGIVVRNVEVMNQHDEAVQKGSFTTMVRIRSEA